MTGATVTLDHNAPQVVAVLRELRAAVQDLRPGFRDAGEHLLRSTDQRFSAQRAPDGTPWAQNSDVTLLRYLQAKGGLSKRRTKTGGRTLTRKGAKALGSKQILRDSGQLQGSCSRVTGFARKSRSSLRSSCPAICEMLAWSGRWEPCWPASRPAD